MLPVFRAGYPPSSGTAPASLPMLMQQLGMKTQIGMNGLVQFNEPLVQQIVAHRQAAVPHLFNTLLTTTAVPVFLEAVHAADRLAELRTPGVQQLYGAVSRWNSHPDPLVQIYLAGLYRKLQHPATFGPMLSTLINRAVTQYPMQASPTHNVAEEVGGAVLQQIAEHTASETVKRLLPYLQSRPQFSQTV